MPTSKDVNYAVPFSLQRVRLNRGGYDASGAYWGHGRPLYRYDYETNLPAGYCESGTLRADDRDDAKAQIRH